MARTRAQRRHNTHKKAARLHRLDTDWGICSGHITPSGERTSCPRCYLENRIYPWNEADFRRHEKAKLSAFILAQD